MKNVLLGFAIGFGLLSCNASTPIGPSEATTSTGIATRRVPQVFYVTKDSTATRAHWTSTGDIYNYSQTNGFVPGDQILFRVGETFNGTVYINQLKPNTGTASNPIVIGSYTQDPVTKVRTRATVRGTYASIKILESNKSGIFLQNVGGYEISNLLLQGQGIDSSDADGIIAYNDLPNNVKLNHINIYNIEVSEFGRGGISIGGGLGKSGYKGVYITNVNSHDNKLVGIQLFGTALPATLNAYARRNEAGDLGAYSNLNVIITNCHTNNNRGWNGIRTNSGSGILIGGSRFVKVERNVSNDNGDRNRGVGGPIGIWSYDADHVNFQFNESYHNNTNSIADGGGFDIDGGTTNSVIQYNYTHDNAGAGILVSEYPGSNKLENNTIRYNISENDGRKHGYGAIHLYGASNILNIHNNTIFVSKPNPQIGTDNPSALFITKPGTYLNEQGQAYDVGTNSNVHVLNNIFYASSGAKLLSVGGGNSNLVLNGNRYFSSDNMPIIGYGGGFINGGNEYTGTFYNSTNLSNFKTATAQENIGSYGNPGLTSAGTSGTLPNFNAYLLASITGYQLTNTSAIKDAGVNINNFTFNYAGSTLHLEPVVQDYYDTNPLPVGTGFSIGASEK
jgi:hypothetical protein